MAKPLPDNAELVFIEATARGTVHIEARVPSWLLPEPQESFRMGDGTGRVLAALFQTATIVRCGRRVFPDNPNPDAPYRRVLRFKDDKLCAACYRTLIPEEQHLAFEHEEPDSSPI